MRLNDNRASFCSRIPQYLKLKKIIIGILSHSKIPGEKIESLSVPSVPVLIKKVQYKCFIYLIILILFSSLLQLTSGLATSPLVPTFWKSPPQFPTSFADVRTSLALATVTSSDHLQRHMAAASHTGTLGLYPPGGLSSSNVTVH